MAAERKPWFTCFFVLQRPKRKEMFFLHPYEPLNTLALINVCRLSGSCFWTGLRRPTDLVKPDT